jgi:hypothetical protein
MAGMHIRYNSTLKQYEYSTTGTDQGPWTKLDLSSHSAAVPPNIAFTNINNPWSIPQGLPTYSRIVGQNSILYFEETQAGGDVTKQWRCLSYNNGHLYWERFNSTGGYLGGGPVFLNDGSFSVPLDTTVGRNLSVQGGQIYFPGAQSATGAANVLDDYEEGAWSPMIYGSSGGVAAGSSYGYYTKIGRVVHLTGLVQLNTVGSIVGNAFIGGVPFQPDVGAQAYTCTTVELANLGANIVSPPQGRISAGRQAIDIFEWQSHLGLHAPLAVSKVTNNMQVVFAGTFFTPS